MQYRGCLDKMSADRNTHIKPKCWCSWSQIRLFPSFSCSFISFLPASLNPADHVFHSTHFCVSLFSSLIDIKRFSSALCYTHLRMRPTHPRTHAQFDTHTLTHTNVNLRELFEFKNQIVFSFYTRKLCCDIYVKYHLFYFIIVCLVHVLKSRVDWLLLVHTPPM